MLFKILINYLTGYVNVEIEGYYVERFINTCMNKGIFLWGINREKTTILYANLGAADVKEANEVAKQHGCMISVKKEKGVPFLVKRYKDRKIFFIALLVLIILIFLLSKFIWNIEVQGTNKIDGNEIIEEAENEGLKVGKLKNKIDTEKIINKIRMEREDISWIGIEMKGTNVIIKIVEAEEKPDIIHLHSSKAGFLGRFATNTKKCKMFYNPHGFSFLMKKNSAIKRTIYWILEKIGGLRNCTVIGCSEGEYEEALKITKKAKCINNGININKLENETKGLRTKEIDYNNLKICTCGRIGKQKNPELFNMLAMQFPNIKFTWIGEGELKDKITSKNITVTGWKSRKDVLEIMNENDIFILTSLWEGLPISLLEAMFLKKVCMVTDCIGNRDVIKNKENGFIINEGNFKQIVESLNNEICEKVSSNARKDVYKVYNTKRMVEEYRKVYGS